MTPPRGRSYTPIMRLPQPNIYFSGQQYVLAYEEEEPIFTGLAFFSLNGELNTAALSIAT
jgi:hypothetical protein